jgi:hypothetical protein
MGQKMKKSLIALILLSGFAGCDRNPTPITIQNKQTNNTAPVLTAPHEAIGTSSTADHLSNVLGNSSPEIITAAQENSEKTEEAQKPDETKGLEETDKPGEITEPNDIEKIVETVVIEKPEETLSPPPISYLSKKDGFTVLMPSVPTEMSLDPTNNTHVRIYQSQTQNGFVQYNVFCHFFQKKILDHETAQTYLNSLLPDRLVGADKGQIVRRTFTKYKGYDAKKFEYVRVEGDAEFIYKAIAFLIDGDSMSLTMVYPKESTPEFTFDEFTESFKLLPLEPRLSSDDWVDKRLGLRFTPPEDMVRLNTKQPRNDLIVSFINEAGHSIGILDATVAYPGITWSDILNQLSGMKDGGNGFYEKTIPGTTTKPPTVQLLRCVNTGEKIYLIQAYAPQSTYFRSVEKLKASMKSFSFDNK